jgi:hypothetical protein
MYYFILLESLQFDFSDSIMPPITRKQRHLRAKTEPYLRPEKGNFDLFRKSVRYENRTIFKHMGKY